MGDGFYRSKDPTNSIKVLKEATKENNNAIVVGLAVHGREKLQDIFKSNITGDELNQNNKSRQRKSHIYDGIVSDSEKNI